MAVAKVSSKGWVVIPAKLRRKFGIEPGDRVEVVEHEGRLTIVPVEEVPDGFGLLHDLPLFEERDKLRREEADIELRKSRLYQDGT